MNKKVGIVDQILGFGAAVLPTLESFGEGLVEHEIATAAPIATKAVADAVAAATDGDDTTDPMKVLGSAVNNFVASAEAEGKQFGVSSILTAIGAALNQHPKVAKKKAGADAG